MDPDKVVRPIYKFTADHLPNQFIGTGFFWSPRSSDEVLFVTANHVLEEGTEEFGVPTFDVDENGLGEGFWPFEAGKITRYVDVDLAIVDFRIPGCEYVQSSPTTINCTHDLITREFSQCRPGREGWKPVHHVTALTRRGHALRPFTLHEHDWVKKVKPGTAMLELSFPALLGASGSPVFHRDDLRLVGIIVGHIERGSEGEQPVTSGIAVRASVLEALHTPRRASASRRFM